MIFVAFGLFIGPNGIGALGASTSHEVATLTFEVTLVLVLFTDAMAVNRGSLRSGAALPGRLLVVGLPLTIILGWALAALMFRGLDLWEAAIVGAILAPTDAALGLAVVSNPRVPELIRQALNVESGLNDGIVLPILLVFVALAEHATGDRTFVMVFLRAVLLAAAIGVAIGWGGARTLRFMAKRGWIGPHWQQICVLALAGLTYGLATPLGGSGFVAAWAGGCAMGFGLGRELPEIRELPEDLASLFTTASFLVFGAFYAGPALGNMTWMMALYAAVSLTLVRMGPVRVATSGTGLARPTVLYLGWFGPRGLASIIFADLILGHALPHAGMITTVVNVTVLVSVMAHGATSRLAAQWYGDWYAGRVAGDPSIPEAGRVEHLATRRRSRQ
jgi:NhaP-type Na+/H+ or K+/H+ antiporter